jgi:hypothetical protein
MASSSSADVPKDSSKRISAKSTADPILRNALRYTISAKEYETLHKYIISRSKVLKRNAPTVGRIEKLVERPGRDDYNSSAVRASLRVFVATAAALKAWELVQQRFLKKDNTSYAILSSNLALPNAYLYLPKEGKKYLFGDLPTFDYHCLFLRSCYYIGYFFVSSHV